MFKTETHSSKFSLYDSVSLVNTDHWNRVVDHNNIYMSLEYLRALEEAMYDTMGFRYSIFYDHSLQPIAVSYQQVINFSNKGNYYETVLCNLSERFKNKLLETIDARILICGNVFSAGENGFAYSASLEPKEAFKLLARSMKAISEEKDDQGQVSFGLVKEFWPASMSASDYLHESGFKGFMIDVNMVVKLQPSWEIFEDYLAAMTTKYRTKAKGVIKKSASLVVEDFDADQIKTHQSRIEELYGNVLDSADFKIGALNAHAFINFKQNLGDKFTFRAYFLEERLVGFICLFHCADVIDANCMGMDYDQNRDYAVYQRMLYDAVEISIKNRVGELRLGRTAELLKSSIGAEPVDMKLYLRHRNSISNKLIGPLISSISPSEYELRPPFKKVLS